MHRVDEWRRATIFQYVLDQRGRDGIDEIATPDMAPSAQCGQRASGRLDGDEVCGAQRLLAFAQFLDKFSQQRLMRERLAVAPLPPGVLIEAGTRHSCVV